MAKTKKKPINKSRAFFIFCCCIVPVINWLVNYVYVNVDSFFMAFTTKDGGFTLDHFVRFFNEMTNPESGLREAFRNTFLTFAIIFVTYPFKVLVSYFLYKKVPGSSFFRIVFFLPGIIFSVALAMIFNKMIGVNGIIAQTVQKWLDLDYVPTLLADSRFANTTVLLHMLWMNFPGDLIIWGGAFARIPEDVIESARIDGVTWWQEFTRITIPLVWPTVAMKMVLLFCGIFGAEGAVFLLTKGDYGTNTFSTWMYLQLLNNTGTYKTSNAFYYMSAVGLVITIIAVTISLTIRRYMDKVFDDVEY